ncbi:hydroxyacylglutathione hydrolase [Lacibacterium aquatile]|uniref:Hydroxyacylglutathione hydrolase n=1 Tax=Lacibacterium aquatile TaxID=1168082 RepID=A0ABW5DRR3_9PROT
MDMLVVEGIPLLTDNYGWILTCSETGTIAAVDAAEPKPILDRTGGRLDFILNTHHHNDHVGANLALKEATGCTIIGPSYDADRIPGIDVTVSDGERVRIGSSEAQVIFTPGHTRGHIAFWFEGDAALFCGDTLFSMGCGRLFEGTPEQMWTSLQRLRALPPETRVFCAHEYTASNARFALSIDPNNADLQARSAEVDRLRSQGLPTVPSLLQQEVLVNPFLKADNAAIARQVDLANRPPVEVFAEIRRRKDNYR